MGAEGDERLHGFDGVTGAVVFSGGGANELMTGSRRFSTSIAARGRIYVANDNRVYAFTVPASTPTLQLTRISLQSGGILQFGFTNAAAQVFTVLTTTNLLAPSTNWTRLGPASEIAPGQYQVRDPIDTNTVKRFYRVSSP